MTAVFTLVLIGLLDITKFKENRIEKEEPSYKQSFNTRESWPLIDISENEIEPMPATTEPFDCSKKVLGGTNYTMIYNVMLKTGSRTFTSLCQRITHGNGIRKHREGRNPVKLTPKNQTLRLNSSLLKNFYQQSSKDAVLIRGHNVYVLPWESNVVFLNTIREPIPWMISLYYYSRYGDGNRAMGNTVDDTSFDECVARNLSYCVPKLFQYLRYFCGESPVCRSHDALSNPNQF
ncbi:putative heparan sulfate 2-O-sulfotransferase 1 [Apostichopus japonicus]|uniref:Putative heparan sulfate 2-O-sulfotransferase 1 n=1 Tax=Stichopus japonicus TaxID=307972 RepID=A0A2G8K7D4_STIJA|nr:putative heparan sulfate 2-O-sulfotransferase 1 [Apostichopus japonicus]